MEHLDVYIALGVQVTIFLGGVYVMVLKNDWSNDALKDRLDKMNQELDKLAQVIVNQAVQTSRLDSQSSQIATLQRELYDLRREESLIQRPSNHNEHH
jgi:nucleotidyltransferase/DNA polymerase involved in DNA repair